MYKKFVFPLFSTLLNSSEIHSMNRLKGIESRSLLLLKWRKIYLSKPFSLEKFFNKFYFLSESRGIRFVYKPLRSILEGIYTWGYFGVQLCGFIFSIVNTGFQETYLHRTLYIFNCRRWSVPWKTTTDI